MWRDRPDSREPTPSIRPRYRSEPAPLSPRRSPQTFPFRPTCLFSRESSCQHLLLTLSTRKPVSSIGRVTDFWDGWVRDACIPYRAYLVVASATLLPFVLAFGAL